jgi:fructan beta-fructosidase
MGQSYRERYRPQFHFTPPVGWMNDPNGLVYDEGEYHLFYQYIPDSIEQDGDKMHWGHAVSADLLHWEHLPVALAPDALGAIWSGSVVVDVHNTSGWQSGAEKALVAIFTHQGSGGQQQSVAYSRDRGRTWQKYEGNPVIPNPGVRDFRDPNVVWHEPTGQWVMVLSGGDRAIFYTSPDLKRWSQASEFGPGQGARGGVWECPALLAMAVDGDRQRQKWVLVVSVGGSAPNGGSGTEYFIGDFDGRNFTNDFPPNTAHWLDYGRDNYAGIAFAQTADERRILMGWLSNWSYAKRVPTSPWRGAMTIPREVKLVTGQGGMLQLVGQPAPELQSLREAQVQIGDVRLAAGHSFPEVDQILNGAFEIEIEVGCGAATEWGLVLGNRAGEATIIGYDIEGRRLFVNRQYSGAIDFSADFAGYLHPAKLLPAGDKVKLRIFVDWSSVEVIAAGGRVWLTELIFPSSPINHLRLYAQGGEAHLHALSVWALKSIW